MHTLHSLFVMGLCDSLRVNCWCVTGPLPSLLYVMSYGWSALTDVDLILVILMHCSGVSQVCMGGGVRGVVLPRCACLWCVVLTMRMLGLCGANHL